MDDAKMEKARKVLREINEFIKQRYGSANDAEPLERCLSELRAQEAEDFEKTAALYHRRPYCEGRRLALAASRNPTRATDTEAQPNSLAEIMANDARDFERECAEAKDRFKNAPR
jgi:hypothetical protein